MIGQTISHYRLIEKIGAGGMGEVYLAEDTKLNRKVALKFLPESLSADPEARERLLREAQAASRLAHPNILTIFAVEHGEGRDFIAMEYIDGLTLDRAADKKHWSTDDLVEIAIQIADGLRGAHEADIVHRDLKPANILIDREGRARILDFGIAKVKGSSKLTKTGSTLGTVSYLSPEQAQGKEVDARSDIFSLGAIFYELITGHLPFGGEHEAAIVYAIANEEPEPLARYKTNVPEELQRIVSKCLAKDPRERYQGAAELVADLRALHRRQVTGTVTPIPARRGKSMLVFGTFAVVALIAAGVALKSRFSPSAKRATERDSIMLAVLPFQNLGSPDDEYFASGITEEILTDLAQIPGLGVISRTSTMKYKDHTQSIKEIAEELGVEYVLEASIQWDKSGPKSRIRLHPQLIRAADDTHVWAGKFDAVLEDIFQVQSSIAAQVAQSLSLALLPERADPEETKPTDNAKAYELYLEARGYASSFGLTPANGEKAILLFEEAIRLDSNFALAHAELSNTLSSRNFGGGKSEYAARAKSEALLSLRLKPDLPQGKIALGRYYNICEQQYDKALELFKQVQFTGVAESDVLAEMGLVRMRQGDWAEALANLNEAFKHDPLSQGTAFLLTQTYGYMRRFDDALRSFDRLVSLSPSDPNAHAGKALFHIGVMGDRDGATRTVRGAATFVEPIEILAQPLHSDLWRYGVTEDSPESVLAFMLKSTQPPADTVGRHFMLADLLTWAGDTAAAAMQVDSARVFLETRIEQLTTDESVTPQVITVGDLRSALGLAYALLGEKQKAVEMGELAMRTVPIDLCHW